MGKSKKIIFFLFISALLFTTTMLNAQEVAVSKSEAAVMRSKMVEYSKKYIGCPYVSGGVGPSSFDCSGFVFAVSRESIKVQLPRTTRAIFSFTTQIKDSEREAGDLVFFKTTSSGQVSHVGIYIGNNQFIHCASDGPNTGVIVSSLKESYWKAHYFCTGRYLPASNSELLADSQVSAQKKTSEDSADSAQTSISSVKTQTKESPSDKTPVAIRFMRNLTADATLMSDWNFYSHNGFGLAFRGGSSMINLSYNFKYVQPGIGSIIRYDTQTRNLRLPFVVSISFLNYFRVYAGPVLFIKHPRDPDDDSLLKQQIFPGIFGFSASSPSAVIKKARVSVVSDIHYTVFKRWNGSSMSLNKALSTGLIFSTGIKVTIPFNKLF